MKPMDPSSQTFKFLINYSDYSLHYRPQTVCQLMSGLGKAILGCSFLFTCIGWLTLYPVIGIIGYIWFNYIYLGGHDVVEFGKGFFGVGGLILAAEFILVAVCCSGALIHLGKQKIRELSPTGGKYQPPLAIQWIMDLHNKICTKISYTDDEVQRDRNDSFKP